MGVMLAQAQTYPDRPIRLIAPFPAGGLADVLARVIGDEMSKSLGQPVIVENRAGAGGNTGADAVAKSAPDGYTLLMSSAGILTANPYLYAKMPFDAATAFIPVSNVAQMNMILVVLFNNRTSSAWDDGTPRSSASRTKEVAPTGGGTGASKAASPASKPKATGSEPAPSGPSTPVPSGPSTPAPAAPSVPLPPVSVPAIPDK